MAIGAAVLTVVSMAGSIYQGVQANNAAKSQADLSREYADIQLNESYREAERIEDEGNRFAINQKNMYLGSGVEIGGSAVITLAQTRKWAKTEADAERKRGLALRDYGYRGGNIQEGEGRAALVGGYGAAVQKGVSYMDARSAGGR